jgi:hypothetical protein
VEKFGTNLINPFLLWVWGGMDEQMVKWVAFRKNFNPVKNLKIKIENKKELNCCSDL